MDRKIPKIIDIEKKIEIWENPEGFSKKSKLDDMKIDFDANRFDSTVKYARDIIGENFIDIQESADTFTYHYEIRGGFSKDTYEDSPFIIPYLVDDSKGAVILLSGGGFTYKTIHGSPNAGASIAKKLNEKGYSAFVLDYRTNPYKFPIPILDFQRAIRFIRYNAEKFKIDPTKITALGFSAGAYIVSIFINKYMGKEFFSNIYTKDAIDEASDIIETVGYIYPALTFNYNAPMIVSVFDKDKWTSDASIRESLDELHLPNHIDNRVKNRFVSYSNSDKTCDYRGTEEYIKSAKEKGVSINRIFVPNKDHGYSNDEFFEDYINWLNFVL